MKVDHIAIVVEDIEAAINWYTTMFDIEVLYQDETWGLVRAEEINTKIAFVLESQHPFHIGIECDELPTFAESGKFHRDGSEYHYETDPWVIPGSG